MANFKFTVQANSTHSSLLDGTNINIYENVKYYFVSNHDNALDGQIFINNELFQTNIATHYFYYTENISNCYVGIFFKNSTSTDINFEADLYAIIDPYVISEYNIRNEASRCIFTNGSSRNLNNTYIVKTNKFRIYPGHIYKLNMSKQKTDGCTYRFGFHSYNKQMQLTENYHYDISASTSYYQIIKIRCNIDDAYYAEFNVAEIDQNNNWVDLREQDFINDPDLYGWIEELSYSDIHKYLRPVFPNLNIYTIGINTVYFTFTSSAHINVNSTCKLLYNLSSLYSDPNTYLSITDISKFTTNYNTEHNLLYLSGNQAFVYDLYDDKYKFISLDNLSDRHYVLLQLDGSFINTTPRGALMETYGNREAIYNTDNIYSNITTKLYFDDEHNLYLNNPNIIIRMQPHEINLFASDNYRLTEDSLEYLIVDSNKADNNTIKIPQGYELVLAHNNSTKIVQRMSYGKGLYLCLLGNDYSNTPYGILADYLVRQKSNNIKESNVIAYLTNAQDLEIIFNNNNLTMKFNESLHIFIGKIVYSCTAEKIAEDLADYNPVVNGNACTVTLPFSVELCYDIINTKLVIRNRHNSEANIYVLLHINHGGITGGPLYPSYVQWLNKNTSLSSDNFLSDGEIVDSSNNIDDKCSAFNNLYNTCVDNEAFVFFTDPHSVNPYVSEVVNRKLINTIQYAFNKTATSYVLCGGDWLQNVDTPDIALNRLGYIDGFMRHKFGDYYLPCIGNHDTNYQGKSSIDAEANTGRLSQDVIARLWFRKYGFKMYYTYKMLNTRLYVFDTELDWYSSMSEYRWEQIDWFANQLIKNNDKHIMLLAHIINNQSQENYQTNGFGIQPLANNITIIAQAYNNRQSITLNSKVYNFSQATGKIACFIGGHAHYDANAVINNIPIIITTNALASNPRFDIYMLDYDNAKLRTVRVGEGNDREIDIIV